MSVYNNLIKIAWNQPMHRKALLELIAEMDHEAGAGLDIGAIRVTTPNTTFKLKNFQKNWKSGIKTQNDQYYKVLAIIDIALKDIIEGKKVPNNYVNILKSLHGKKTTVLNKVKSTDDANDVKWKQVIRYLADLAEYIVTLSELEPSEPLKERAKELLGIFEKHLRRVGVAIHADPGLQKEIDDEAPPATPPAATPPAAAPPATPPATPPEASVSDSSLDTGTGLVNSPLRESLVSLIGLGDKALEDELKKRKIATGPMFKKGPWRLIPVGKDVNRCIMFPHKDTLVDQYPMLNLLMNLKGTGSRYKVEKLPVFGAGNESWDLNEQLIDKGEAVATDASKKTASSQELLLKWLNKL